MNNYDPLYFEYKLLYDTDRLSKYEIYHEEVISGHEIYGWGTSNPDGNVYFPPMWPSVVNILSVSPDSKQVSLINVPNIGTTVTNKFYDSVSAVNGSVILLPGANYNRIITYSPTDGTFNEIISNDLNSSRYMTATTGYDGRIYMPPRNGTSVAIFDPMNGQLDFNNYGLNIPSTANKYHQSILHSNGKIYCAPTGNTPMLIIDTINNSAEYIPNYMSDSNYTWSNITVDPLGRLVSLCDGIVYCYSPDTEEIVTTSLDIETGYSTNWSSAKILPNGVIIFLVTNSNSAMLIFYDSIKGILAQSVRLPVYNENIRYCIAGNGDIVVTIPNYGILFLRNGLRTQVPHNIHYSKFGK